MKKHLLQPYLISLTRDHIGYIIFDVVLILILILFFVFNTHRITQNRQKVIALTKEVDMLRKKLNTLNSSNYSNADLKKYLTFLNTLIPNSEDYFSIIYSLEEISQKTNFIVTSYDINLKQSTANKLKLIISGTGDRQNFMNFLKSYTFSGGRLITSDKIELNSQVDKVIKVDVTFYNKKVDSKISNQSTISLQSINEVASLYKKVNFTLKNQNTDNFLPYPTKTNPF